MPGTSPPTKRPYQLVLANRCALCNEPKGKHERDKDGDIRLKDSARTPGRRWPAICQPNPYAARKIAGTTGAEGNYARGTWVRRVA